MVAMTIIVYRFFSDYLPSGIRRAPPAQIRGRTMTAWVPMVFAALSLVALWIFAKWRNAFGGALLVAR